MGSRGFREVVREADRSANAEAGRARVGLGLFLVYVLLYAGFMGLVLVRPEWLSWRPFGGVNLAIAYGMLLIASTNAATISSMP